MAAQKTDENLSETENFFVWRSPEEDVGYIYHLELGSITLHLLPDEWDELVVLLKNSSN